MIAVMMDDFRPISVRVVGDFPHIFPWRTIPMHRDDFAVSAIRIVGLDQRRFFQYVSATVAIAGNNFCSRNYKSHFYASQKLRNVSPAAYAGEEGHII